MRPIILDYQPECRLGWMSQNMSPFSPLEMHDSNDIPTSVSLTFLDFRLRLMEPPWTPGCSRWKNHCYARWCEVWCAGQQIWLCFFPVSQWYHPTHPASTQYVTFLHSHCYNLQQEQRAGRLEIVSNFYNIISISVTVSLACLPHYPLKRKNF